MRLAYLCHPHAGGTYGVFRTLRAGLAPSGADLRWVAASPAAHAACATAEWRGDLAAGVLAGTAGVDERAQGLALLQATGDGGFDGVLVNVLSSRAEMNVARYLPRRVRRVAVVHNITPATYAAARSLRGHVHATVGVSPRIRRDLIARHGFDPSLTFCIPNAAEFPWTERITCGSARFLRLLYLGRVEDAAKGVLLLPSILQGLGPSVTLTVAGGGPDLPVLQARCLALPGQVRFLGEVPPSAVPGLLASHDALIMPSRFEGLPLVLIEAMAAGCVPVATRLSGVTDTLVTHGQDGLLFPAGDARAARRAVQDLAADRAELRRLSANAQLSAQAWPSARDMADAYLAVIARADTDVRPLDPTGWRVPLGMRPGLRTFLPAPVKNALRSLRERSFA